MEELHRAGLNCQLMDEPCDIEDTKHMFWLGQSDDYKSRVDLGNALAAQYRYKEAIDAYKKALIIRQDDWKLLNRLAGAQLTIRRFEEAMANYRRCLNLGADKKTIAYPLGIGCYLQKDFKAAAAWFENCLPCDDEMAIAVIYWHTMSCYRCGLIPKLLDDYNIDMNVGHHFAYKLAVSVFCKENDYESVLAQLEKQTDELSYVIALYGICVYLDFKGKKNEN